MIKICIECGHEYESNHQKSLVCGKECAKLRHKKVDKISRETRAYPTYTCSYCKKEYQNKNTNNDGKKYCSRDCAFKDKTDKRLLKKQQQLELPKYSKVYFLKCEKCDSVVSSRVNIRRICSSCQCQSALSRQRIEYRLENPFQATEIKCSECNKKFIAYRKSTVYCSIECGNRHFQRASNHRRRARIRGNEYETIRVIEIFNRDKWRCQLCGVKTPMKLKGSNVHNAPSLDHIIPLAKGGSHTKDNVQCACRQCNSIKSDKPRGQLLLFG